MLIIDKIIEIHKEIFLYMHSFSVYCSDFITFLANKLDNWILLLFMLLMAFFFHKKYGLFSKKRFKILFRESIVVGISILSAWGISGIIKLLVAAPRPFLRFPELVNNLFPYGGYNSFPSGHATLFAALSCILFFYHRKTAYFFTFITLVISITRIIAGVHFPVDILVGWILGTLVSYFVFVKVKKYI